MHFYKLAALATMLFVSCNKEANYPSLIQGTWESQTIQTTFTKNGKAITAAEFVADITDAEMKKSMTEVFNKMTGAQAAKGISLNFSKR